MNINKAIAPILASIALGVVAMVPSIAAPTPGTLAPIASVTTATSDNTSFTSASGGDSLVVTYPDGTFASKIGLGTYSSVAVSLTATGGTTSTSASFPGTFEETFTGGTFSDYFGGTKLLKGTFTSGSIFGKVGSITGGLDISGVTYDADSVALGSFSPSFGTISLTYNVIKPSGYSLVGGKLQSFTATDSGTYSAVSTVPEPATVAPFIMGGLGLMGLAFRARKTRRSNGAAA